MIGKRAVQLAVHDLELNHVEPLEHRWHHQPAHPICRISYDLERTQTRYIDERQHMVGKFGEQIAFGHLARVTNNVGAECRTRKFAHLGQTAVDANRLGACFAHFDAVVLRRVVRSREHGTRHVHISTGVVQQVCAGQTQVDHRCPTRCDTVFEGGHQTWP